MKLIEADGQDVEAVYLATLARSRARLAGKGPVFLHLRTHRLTGHFVGDPQVYRDKEAFKEERETKDPIGLLGARLELGDDEFAALDAEVTAEGRGGRRVREERYRPGSRRRAQVRLCLS